MSIERKIFAGLVAILLLVAAVASIAFWAMSQFNSSTGWVGHTYEVLQMLDGVQSVVQRAESHQRGFLLTGNRSFLSDSAQIRVEVSRRLAALEELIKDNPAQRVRVALLRADIDERMRRLDEGVAARRTGGIAAAVRDAGQGGGLRAMDRFGARISMIKGAEQSLLEARERDVGAKAMQAQIAIGLLCALGLCLVLLVFWAISVDLAGRKRAEARVTGLNRELEDRVYQLRQANRALESFASSVSHDLRAPLRSISGFTQALSDDYSEKLDERGRDFLRRVLGASVRMGGLIEDLLKLARISQVEMSRAEVDLSALARSICAQLQAAEPSRSADIEIQPGLTARGDPGLLAIAFENLLGNAWKFTSHAPSARIKFGAASERGETVFFVADNGAGFEMAYSSGLFRPFRRLHTESEFKGTGVGLATVRRIIERHGGRIWARAERDKGATFYFTLEPSRQRSDSAPSVSDPERSSDRSYHRSRS